LRRIYRWLSYVVRALTGCNLSYWDCNRSRVRSIVFKGEVIAPRCWDAYETIIRTPIVSVVYVWQALESLARRRVGPARNLWRCEYPEVYANVRRLRRERNVYFTCVEKNWTIWFSVSCYTRSINCVPPAVVVRSKRSAYRNHDTAKNRCFWGCRIRLGTNGCASCGYCLSALYGNGLQALVISKASQPGAYNDQGACNQQQWTESFSRHLFSHSCRSFAARQQFSFDQRYHNSRATKLPTSSWQPTKWPNWPYIALMKQCSKKYSLILQSSWNFDKLWQHIASILNRSHVTTKTGCVYLALSLDKGFRASKTRLGHVAIEETQAIF